MSSTVEKTDTQLTGPVVNRDIAINKQKSAEVDDGHSWLISISSALGGILFWLSFILMPESWQMQTELADSTKTVKYFYFFLGNKVFHEINPNPNPWLDNKVLYRIVAENATQPLCMINNSMQSFISYCWWSGVNSIVRVLIT